MLDILNWMNDYLIPEDLIHGVSYKASFNKLCMILQLSKNKRTGNRNLMAVKIWQACKK
jgi:hypothetical protein